MSGFDLTIKNIDPYTVRLLPVLLDLLLDRHEFDREDHGEMLAELLEACADQFRVPEDKTAPQAVYQNEVEDRLTYCVCRLRAALQKYQAEESD